MSKYKVRKTAKKRFKITGRKKIIHYHSGASHLRRKETVSAHRRKNRPRLISSSFHSKVRRLLGI